MGILEWIQNIDAQILLFIQQYIRQDMMNWFWKGITFLGDGGWFWIVLGVVTSDPEENKKVRFYRPSCTDHRIGNHQSGAENCGGKDSPL